MPADFEQPRTCLKELSHAAARDRVTIDSIRNPDRLPHRQSTGMAEQRTITGTLNESEQLISARGDVYEIADTEAGTAMLYEAAEDVVQVTGEVVEDEEINIITVSSFKVLATTVSYTHLTLPTII